MYNDRDFIRYLLLFIFSYHIITCDTLAVWTLLNDDSDDEGDKIDHRLLPREKKRRMNHDRARRCIEEDYLAANSRFNGSEFKKMFRISRPQFELIACELAKWTTFYHERPDAVGNTGACVIGKFMIALKSLAYGCNPFAFRDYFQMSETLARKSYDTFVDLFPKAFQDEYLRFPTKDDVRRILRLHKYSHNVSGMLGSLDVSHIPWKNCPKQWHGQFRGKSKRSTVALEAIVDYNLYFWHASFGYPGSLNDLNVLNVSTLLQKFTENGLLSDIEQDFVPFDIANESFQHLFYLVDGIYPPWARFLKTVQIPLDSKETAFSKWQEGARKDIERSFSQLTGAFPVVYNPMRAMSLKRVSSIVITCVILHNMRVEEYVSGEGNKYKADDGIDMEQYDDPLIAVSENDEEATRARNENARRVWLQEYMAAWNKLTNLEEHKRLQNAVIDYMFTSRRE
jgi:predicted nucleic-acid-binding Zn-ribbon protein